VCTLQPGPPHHTANRPVNRHDPRPTSVWLQDPASVSLDPPNAYSALLSVPHACKQARLKPTTKGHMENMSTHPGDSPVPLVHRAPVSPADVLPNSRVSASYSQCAPPRILESATGSRRHCSRTQGQGRSETGREGTVASSAPTDGTEKVQAIDEPAKPVSVAVD